MNNIVNELVNEIKELMGEGYNVNTHIVKKNNGIERTAVCIKDIDNPVAPTIYVEDYVEEIEKGSKSTLEVAEEIINIYEEHKIEDMDVTKIASKDYILENANIRLVNFKKNEERSKNMLILPYLDLGVELIVKVSDIEGGMASYTLRKEILDNAGLDVDEVYNAALENNSKNLGTVKSMAEVLREMGVPVDMFGDEGSLPMYIITNENKINGANQILNPKMLEKTYEKIGSDFYILPSSIHECIAVPVDNNSAESLRDMVGSVNATEVQDQEILSNSVYIYTNEDKKLNIA